MAKKSDSVQSDGKSQLASVGLVAGDAVRRASPYTLWTSLPGDARPNHPPQILRPLSHDQVHLAAASATGHHTRLATAITRGNVIFSSLKPPRKCLRIMPLITLQAPWAPLALTKTSQVRQGDGDTIPIPSQDTIQYLLHFPYGYQTPLRRSTGPPANVPYVHSLYTCIVREPNTRKYIFPKIE